MTDIEVRMVESHLVALMLQWDYMFKGGKGVSVIFQRGTGKLTLIPFRFAMGGRED